MVPPVLPSQILQSVPEAANFDRCLGAYAQSVSFRSAHANAIMSVACVLCSLDSCLEDTWYPCQFAAGPMTRRSWPQLRPATSNHFGSGCSDQRRQTLIWSRCLQCTILLTSTSNIGCMPNTQRFVDTLSHTAPVLLSTETNGVQTQF